MSGFLTNLLMKPASRQKDDGEWILCASLVYKSDLVDGYITVPEGFQTDLASVPRIPFVYEAFGSHADEAAVLHDWLYNTRQFSRSQSDDILQEAAISQGVSSWRAWSMWAGVRLGGWFYWREPSAPSAQVLVDRGN